MTTTEFNDKYKDKLEEGHYGLAIGNEAVITYLDGVFGRLVVDGTDFTYSQIKLKFGTARVYLESDTIPFTVMMLVGSFLESAIDNIIKNQNENNN